MADEMRGVPIGDLPGIGSVPDDSMLVVEFLGKAYSMPGAVLRQMIQDVLDAMGGSVDDVTEARLTAAIETVLAEGKYNGVSPFVEVLDEEDGTSVIHVIDAFGVKKYPVEVKGARNAVQYVKQELTSGQQAIARANIGAAAYKSREVYVVNISGNYKDGFKAVFGSTSSSAGPLTAMAAYGHVVVGVATEDLVFPYLFDMPEMYDWPDKEYTLPAGTVFNYNDGRFFATYNTGLYRELENKIFTIRGSTSGLVWSGEVETEQYVFYLINPYDNDLACSFEYDGVGIPMEGLGALVYDAVDNHKPIFCYQKDAVFKLDDGSAYQPPIGVPFYYDKNAEVFRCEIDGFECTAYVLLYGFKLTAKKTKPLNTAESKGDDLKLDPIANTLSLLSAGEPIGKPIPLPTGGGTGEGGGVIAPVNGFFTLSVDSDGNLWAHSAEGGTTPDFEYDSETGNLYFLTEQE